MTSTMTTGVRAALLGTALLTGACATDPVHVEEDFGRSVRQMVEAQISDPDAAAEPSPHGPDRLDGVAARDTLSGYRARARRGRGGSGGELRLSID